jgi:16S rRNA (cytosine967-C5)-methyltransferase
LRDKSPQTGSAREAALKALVRYEQDHAYLNLALPNLIKDLSEPDKALAAKLSSGTIQHLNTIDWALQLYSKHKIDSLTPWLRNLLRVSAYQLIYLEKVPDYAVVDEAVNLARRYGHRGVAGLTNALLRKLAAEVDSLPWPEATEEPLECLSLRHSYPPWLIKRLLDRYGFDETEKWCLANLEKPSLSARVNRLRTTAEVLIDKLKKEQIEAFTNQVVPDLLVINAGASKLAQSSSFSEGLLTIQGQSSALVAPLLKPQPGEVIIDLCSAPGGKTTHLAELQQDLGVIYAVELHQSRIGLIQKAATRLGLKSIIPVQADGRELVNLSLPAADAVLVDAPCSGLGVIRRLPEIKWRRTGQDLIGFQKLQLELLAAAARQLRPGGRLLYSVCTAEPEETVQVTELFQKDHPDFITQSLSPLLPPPLQPCFKDSKTLTLLPHRHNFDGFFIALWQKKDNNFKPFA